MQRKQRLCRPTVSKAHTSCCNIMVPDARCLAARAVYSACAKTIYGEQLQNHKFCWEQRKSCMGNEAPITGDLNGRAQDAFQFPIIAASTSSRSFSS